ncbi:helix-turn-helix domain-containing protein [Rhizobium pusense]|nr:MULTISPECIES: helix-turn-helix domain-containing protein [Rhizobium/Agrobacterium group]MDH0910662.1 helix-turn-helix domain-containing protein [Agrobacterium pusense]MDH1095582.1 helix-turn-helix domain-containing protein [Agrobacterium pusense]MDH1113240.1 helix-turn-helix domain-containing protein [Agrobacterium pusense]MDH2192934.1 helix-turn-helix domain-containing protein [Agrobacterium pusense]CAD7057977.1 helix-turn-helix domain-containing protein [Rhizobium sp. P007]
MALLEENDILFAHKALTLMSGLTDATKRVAGAIIDHFNKRTGQCDPGIDRLSTLLGINRATVIRATEALDELGLIQKTSHGGKSHRASYRPNWEQFQAIVADWDARMKSGKAPADDSDNEATNVARLRSSRSQGCDVKGRTLATQTLRRNPSKEPIETEHVETPVRTPAKPNVRKTSDGLGRGSKQPDQRSMLLPIDGGRVVSHEDAARAAAERRWYAQVHSLGENVEADVLDWMTADRQEAATLAEMRRRGGGIQFIVAAMRGGKLRMVQ